VKSASLLAALLLGWSLDAAAACPPGMSEGEHLTGRSMAVTWKSVPSPVPVGQYFRLALVACTSAQQPFAGTIAIDANMPLHRHGMNYRASVRSQGDGRYLAEGLLFHMPGRWQITIDTDDGQQREHLVTELEVE